MTNTACLQNNASIITNCCDLSDNVKESVIYVVDKSMFAQAFHNTTYKFVKLKLANQLRCYHNLHQHSKHQHIFELCTKRQQGTGFQRVLG